MTTRPRLLLATLAVVLAACATGGGGGGDVLTSNDGTGPLPQGELASLEDPDTTVSTASWQGTPTVVNVWATWCGPCREELPELQAASAALGERVRFVGIDRTDPRDEALELLAASGVTYDNVADPRDDYVPRLGIRGMPTTLFVDADGVVRHRWTGPLDEAQVLDLVAEHLGVDAAAG